MNCIFFENPKTFGVFEAKFLLHQIGDSGIVVFAIIRVISTLLADPKRSSMLYKRGQHLETGSYHHFLLRSFFAFNVSTPFGQKLLYEVK